MPASPFHAKLLSGLSLERSSGFYFNCCKFICATAQLYPEMFPSKRSLPMAFIFFLPAP